MPITNAQLQDADAFARDLAIVDAVQSLFSLASRFYRRMGYEHLIYMRDNRPDGSSDGFYFTTYPQEFAQRYRELNYRNDDPVVHALATKVTPFTWASVINQRTRTAAERRLFGEAAEFRLVSGASVPLYGPELARARLVVCGELNEAEAELMFAETRHLLLITAAYLHERAVELTTSIAQPIATRLSQRESEVLSWAANGKTNWEIGAILNLGEQTIKEHVRAASAKLGAANRTQACAIGLWRGHIKLGA